MFAIAPTDLEWFDRLRAGPVPELINFWTPTPWNVRRLTTNDRLYFLLKHPIRKVGGYGIFDRYIELSAADAWEEFGIGNGVDSRESLAGKVRNFAAKRSLTAPAPNPQIGCILLREPVFLNDGEFISPDDVGHSFPKEVVKLKYFTDADRLATTLGSPLAGSMPFTLVAGSGVRKRITRKDRKGQAEFRQMVLRNYAHRCCVTGSGVVELLEAAHIQPYIDKRSDHPQNELCMRVDLHRLFDSGLITIDASFQLRASPKLAGTGYDKLSGQPVKLPTSSTAHPSIQALDYHRHQVFR
ncbi:HNH endonuclease [Rhizobium mulingense]|uniref:HNH endonuclease n=1 Tax=Rhizobium mulingense TaxID=3031128 RepID=UPI002B4872AD|nr:HNH endonuclease [Rhizobium sp. MJ21]MEB3047693.1 HNH endonuclease [Rhizobium sp. MJ21]